MQITPEKQFPGMKGGVDHLRLSGSHIECLFKWQFSNVLSSQSCVHCSLPSITHIPNSLSMAALSASRLCNECYCAVCVIASLHPLDQTAQSIDSSMVKNLDSGFDCLNLNSSSSMYQKCDLGVTYFHFLRCMYFGDNNNNNNLTKGVFAFVRI